MDCAIVMVCLEKAAECFLVDKIVCTGKTKQMENTSTETFDLCIVIAFPIIMNKEIELNRSPVH